MSLVKCFVAASLATLALSPLHAEPRCPGNVATLTLRRIQDDLIVVRVLINRTGPYDFLVDTGSQITTIDPVLASDLHLRIEGTAGVSGVATQSRSAFAFLDLIQVGSHSVPQSLVVIQDIAEVKAADPRIRGILGENFLSHFDLLIDNRQQILCLDESRTLAQAVKGEHIPLEQPFGSRDDLPFTRHDCLCATDRRRCGSRAASTGFGEQRGTAVCGPAAPSESFRKSGSSAQASSQRSGAGICCSTRTGHPRGGMSRETGVIRNTHEWSWQRSQSPRGWPASNERF
jgi:hypothetical protein